LNITRHTNISMRQCRLSGRATAAVSGLRAPARGAAGTGPTATPSRTSDPSACGRSLSPSLSLSPHGSPPFTLCACAVSECVDACDALTDRLRARAPMTPDHTVQALPRAASTPHVPTCPACCALARGNKPNSHQYQPPVSPSASISSDSLTTPRSLTLPCPMCV